VTEESLELRVLGEDGPPRRLPPSGVLVIGASAERAGLVLSGQGVDDAHCAIGPVKGGGFAVKDLGSRSGTIVNGKKVASARLAAGDTLVLGSREVRVVDPRQPAPSAAPRASAAAPPAPEAPAAAARTLPGMPKRVGGYLVERVLGRGGMGTVLLAVQESLHRHVALKLLSPRLAADREFVARFQKEARAAAALNHPNVVVVHDVGEADGFHFLSMEYMEKGSLEERLTKTGKLPWREVLGILQDAARGLRFAEEKGIVHRDIKPANLMQNAAGTIKIADLGLATSVEAEASESDGRKIFGTPHFISPEQARGETVDQRSDLYSLGATAYQLLSGRTPFEGETTRDILRGHLTEEPPPLQGLVPALPAGLDAVVRRLLAKLPAERPASAGALLADLDRLRLELDHGVSVGPAKRPRRLLFAGLALAAAGAVFLLSRGNEGGPVDRAIPHGPLSAPAAPPETDADLFSEARRGPEDAAATLEAELRERNLLAENAYLRIPADLPKAERRARLAALAQEYAGTDTAARAADEGRALEGELAAAKATESEATAVLGAAEYELRRLSGLFAPATELPRPGEALRQAASFTPPAGAAPEEARALVKRIENEIVARAEGAFAAELARLAGVAEEGRFEDVQRALEDLLARFDLPAYEPGEEPEGLAALRQQEEEARTWLARLSGEEQDFAESRAAGDRAALAAALRPGGDVRAKLASLDLEGGAEALARLAGGLGTEQRRDLALALKDDLAAGREMLTGLATAFGEGTWRRRSVLDPRGGKPVPRDAAACDAQGLYVDDHGEPQLIPWSAFAASTEAWVQLFKERLGRPYTAREEQGGAGLVRVSAALEAAALARQMLDPASRAHFSGAEAEELLALYSAPEPWVQAAPRFARERAAAGILVQALTDLEAGSWSGAEAGLSTLLADYGDTLLVALLSDGSDWTDSGMPPDAPQDPEDK